MKDGLVLLMDLSASLYLALLDAQGKVLSTRVRLQGNAVKGPPGTVRGESAHDLLDECFQESGMGPDDLVRICIGTGPGSFTGIRVGVALAQGLAFPKRLPLYPYSSLAALETAIKPQGTASRISIIAATAGNYFVRSEATGRESLMTIGDLAACGSGAIHMLTFGNIPDRERLASVFASVQACDAGLNYSQVLDLALRVTPILDGVIRPNYIMASAAEEKRREAGEKLGRQGD